MKKFTTLALGAVILVTAAPVCAQDTAPAAPKPPKERRICRTEVAVGSIMPKTTCHSKSEWAAIDEANELGAQRAMGHPRNTAIEH